MFGWFSNSSKKEIQSPIITTQQGNEMTIPQNLVSIDDIVLLEKSENWLEMITACDFWAVQQPSNPLPYFSSGNANRKIGKPIQAVSMYRKAIEVSNFPSNILTSDFFPIPQCWYGLGHAYAQLGEQSKAANAFIQAASLDPSAPDIWNDLGVIYLNLKPYDTEKAFEAFKKAIQIDPKNVKAITNIGIVYAICGKEDPVNMIYRELLLLEKTEADKFLKIAKVELQKVKTQSK